jgi:cell division protein FtsB
MKKQFPTSQSSASKLASAVMIIVVCVLLFITVTGNHGLLHLLSVSSEVEHLRQQNNTLESEIVEMDNRIAAIQHSSEVLEKNAREQLGLSKPGEIIYIFPEIPTENQK